MMGFAKPLVYLAIVTAVLGGAWKFADMAKDGVRAEMLNRHNQELTEINSEWKTALEGFQDNLDALTQVQREANAESRRLNDIFGQHDLRALAVARPGLIENRINAGTLDAYGMLERITGQDDPDTGEAP